MLRSAVSALRRGAGSSSSPRRAFHSNPAPELTAAVAAAGVQPLAGRIKFNPLVSRPSLRDIAGAPGAAAAKDNILQVRRKYTLPCNMTFPFSMIGENSTLRGLTTMVHSESLGQDISTASPDPDHSPDPDQRQRIKFKRLSKTAKHIMNILDKEEVEKVQADREVPDIRPGYIIQLKVEVPENKRRVSTLKGIVIARRNAGLHTTFRLRRLVAGVGVESVFPLYSPNIKEVKVLDKKKVRRAKLYYLRDRMNPLKK